jgi:nucleoside-diphosphate-sugar epimerase
MNRAFVAGATGYTGQQVVHQLADRGVTVVAHIRPDSPSAARWQDRFRSMNATTDGTPWQPDALVAALRAHQPDVVFALLGTTRARAKRAVRSGGAPADYEAVDYGLTHMLLEATRAAAPSAVFVYLSSFGARMDTGNEYLRARGRIESELARSGLRCVVARPLFITGPDREESRPAERIGAVVSDAVLRAFGLIAGRAARDRFRSITASRLAAALIDAADERSATNHILEAGELQRRADAASSRYTPSH